MKGIYNPSLGQRVHLGGMALLMACFLFLIIHSILHLINTLLGPPIAISRQVAQYQSGQCTILSKTLHRSSRGNYSARFIYTVHAKQGDYQASEYALVAELDSSPDKTRPQAILDSYQVGANYPCWYDPAQPSDAVLNKDISGLFLDGSLIVVMFFCIVFAGFGLIMLFLVVIFTIGAVRPSTSPLP